MSKIEETIRDWIVIRISREMNVPEDRIDVHAPFVSFGLSSACSVALVDALGKWLELKIEPILVWFYPNISALSQHLAEVLADAQKASAVGGSEPTLTSNRMR
jgi:phthiocerol/phenolphthiocerol synthesis type-I polyketide synthase D